MKRIVCLFAATATLAAAAKSFEDSPLFVKRVDPYSGVVSYLLKPKIHSFSQQSIYFTNKSVTDDGRFLLFSASDNPQDRKKRVTVVDLEKASSRFHDRLVQQERHHSYMKDATFVGASRRPARAGQTARIGGRSRCPVGRGSN